MTMIECFSNALSKYGPARNVRYTKICLINFNKKSLSKYLSLTEIVNYCGGNSDE
jgi:hypothetical protein